MHVDGGIEGDESVEEGLPAVGDEVSAHGDEQAGIGEHHGAGRTPGHRDPVTRDTAQARVLALNRVV